MSAMVQVGMTALAAMVLVETIVFLALEEEEQTAIVVLVKVEKDALHVVELEEIRGMTLVAPIVMVEDSKTVTIATVVDIKNVACAGGAVIKTAFLVMVVGMKIVMNVMDMEDCVWNVAGVMAMVN